MVEEKVIYKCSNNNPVTIFQGKGDTRKASGHYIGLTNLYPNIFLCSKKQSGKTTALANILIRKIGKNTELYIFCPTYYADDTYKALDKYLKKKNYQFEVFDSIYQEDEDEKGKKFKFNIIEDIFKDSLQEDPDDKPKSSSKKKLVFPEIIIVLDDLPQNELRDKHVETVMKRNRHSKACIIISSQSAVDLTKTQINQLQYSILFKGIPEDRLRRLYEELRIWTSFETFEDIYRRATSDDYDFLLIDSEHNKFQKNLG